MKNQPLASLLLRVGLGFAFLYVAVSAWLAPYNWLGFFPKFIVNSTRATFLLQMHLLVDAVLGLWLLSGKKVFIAAILAGLTLLAIVAVNLDAMDIVFRDLALAFAAFALAALHKKESKF